MQRVYLVLAISMLLTLSCARKAIPGRIEQLNAQKQEDLATTQMTNTHLQDIKELNKKKARLKKKKESVDNQLNKLEDSTTILLRDNGKYVDVDYANNVYRKLAKLYGDSISADPKNDAAGVNYAKDFVGSTNFNMRKPFYVIIHHTAQDSVATTLRTFTLERTEVSAHYVIGRNGEVHHMVNDYLRAWQAGSGKWGNITDMNSCSIGIELDNNGFQPFSDEQINTLLELLTYLKKKFTIPTANFIGHADYAPTRKNDPNVFFPWKKLADNGFGLWWSDTTNVTVPENFNEYQALRIIGYDVSDISKTIIAFRRHFCSVESISPSLSPEERKILYVLYSRYL